MKNAILSENSEEKKKRTEIQNAIPVSLTVQESTAKEDDFVWPDQNLWSQRV